ncbi:hypothetical protein WNY97_15000 [Pseudoalteromonas fuliginea]|uniref:hypothetical protein n=1 Tax=Pseudoalteromonas fuliginea TaxID=1872678 RepID=UPI003177B5C4
MTNTNLRRLGLTFMCLIIACVCIHLANSPNDKPIEDGSIKFYKVDVPPRFTKKILNSNSASKSIVKKPQYIIMLNKALLIGAQQQRIEKISDILKMWIKKAPYSCLSWLNQQRATKERTLYISKVMRILISENLSIASDIILSTQEFYSNLNIVNEYLNAQAKVNPYYAIDWLNALDNSNIKKEAELSLLKVWAKHDPIQLLEYLEINTQIKANDRKLIQHELALQLTSQNPQKLQDEFYTYPSLLQPDLAYSIISQWPEGELNKALEWIHMLEGEEAKFYAIQSYIDYTGSSIVGLTPLIDQIHNPTLRARLFDKL